MALPYKLPYLVGLRREQRASDSRVQRLTPSVLADSERTRRCLIRSAPRTGGRQPSFSRVVRYQSACSRSATRMRSLHGQHRLPSAVPYVLQSGQAGSVLAPVAAPGACGAPPESVRTIEEVQQGANSVNGSVTDHVAVDPPALLGL